jgi:hypothetical protein
MGTIGFGKDIGRHSVVADIAKHGNQQRDKNERAGPPQR